MNNSLPSSYLFVPGNRPDRFAKALAAGADAVIIDLEDAVPAGDKNSARAQVEQFVHTATPLPAIPVFVRVNDPTTRWFEDDLKLLKQSNLAGVFAPKTELADQVGIIAAGARSGLQIVPMIESALGLKRIDSIAGARGTTRLVFGNLDFANDLGAEDVPEVRALPSLQIVLASRVAGIAPPIAGVTVAIQNPAQLAADITEAKRLGFGAKVAIHPSQVAAINAGFAPTAEQIAWARRVLDAVRTGMGAVQVDGKMVDQPVIFKAKSILAQAGLEFASTIER